MDATTAVESVADSAETMDAWSAGRMAVHSVVSRVETTVYLDATTAVESVADWAAMMDASSVVRMAVHSVVSRVETMV